MSCPGNQSGAVMLTFLSASYGSYPPPPGYTGYEKYEAGTKRDGVVEAREAEAGPAPAPENE